MRSIKHILWIVVGEFALLFALLILLLTVVLCVLHEALWILILNLEDFTSLLARWFAPDNPKLQRHMEDFLGPPPLWDSFRPINRAARKERRRKLYEESDQGGD